MGLKKMNHLIEHPHVPSQNKKEQNEISFKFFHVEGEKNITHVSKFGLGK